MLISTPGLEDHITGILMQTETARQIMSDGSSFIDHLRKRGIIPGVRVDAGLGVAQGTEDEPAAFGIQGLFHLAPEYYKLGCRFATWRAAFKVGTRKPSSKAIEETTVAIGKYA